MFSNSGEKIKAFAIAAFLFTLLLGILAGVLVSNLTTAGLGILVGLIGLPSAYTTSLLVYGFGDIISNTAKTNEQLDALLKRTIELEQKLGNQNKPQNPINPPLKRKELPATPPPPVVTVERTADNLTCPACGFTQRSNRKICYNCEAVFQEEPS